MYDPPPERPLESDCCGSGCLPCILDVYEDEYSRWKIRQTNHSDQLRRDMLSVTKNKPFKIAAIEQLNKNTRLYTFIAYPETNGYLPIIYTQHIFIQVDNITRPFTPISLSENCSFKVLIKSYINGKFSEKLIKKSINDIVYVRGPSGGIQFNNADKLNMFCAGSGIAAFIGFIQTILKNEKCFTIIDLHYSCKTLDDILLRKMLFDFSLFWNCKISLYLTKEEDWTKCSESFWYNETFFKGRISESVIKDIINKNKNSQSLWFICGTNDFNQHCLDCLLKYNINKENIQIFHDYLKKK
ncbi:NADH-cytochrome b5 reductase-like [Daktulosphaira vitifoliae]|uniref:NADH-cytochrome b5 reductase-like n=1 Tax=Daktulosphaira vitifoliae TaxID=58002 RepID=UPI0021AA8235|nr:NADH-cytochrome b5 reductase-like [Daktulosphaira vitifoliae]